MQPGPASSHTRQQIYSFCIYCKSIRLSRMILCLLIVMVTIPLVSHYYLSRFYQDASSEHTEHHSRTKLEHNDDDDDDNTDEERHSQLDSHVDELKRIKASVNNELRDLENKRQKLQSELSVYTSHVTSLKTEFDHLSRAINQLKVSIEQAMVQHDELARKHMPIISAPSFLIPGLEQPNIHLDMPSLPLSLQCRMHTSFDYSRCSLLSGFPVYFYTPAGLASSESSVILEQFIENSVTHAFHSSVYLTHDANAACIYVVLVGETQGLPGNTMNKQSLENMLQHLPHWHGDGRNHILLNLDRNPASNQGDMFHNINTGRAMLAQSSFSQASFRTNFDIVIPPSLGKSDGDVWKGLPPQSPVRRTYMLSFIGEYYAGHSQSLGVNNVNMQGHDNEQQSASATLTLSGDVIAVLKSMQTLAPDQFMFSFSCGANEERVQPVYCTDWALCSSDSGRENLLKQSTFSLIIAPSNFSIVSTSLMLTRLYEALKFGAIPIILGDHVQLPFSESLHWQKALLIIPRARVTEMHFYLNTVIDGDIADLRRHGRIIWETFFGSTRKIIDTLLLTVRRRLGIPAAAMHDEAQISIFNQTFKQNTQVVSQIDAEMGDEILGPLEPAFASPRFHHNLTSVHLTDNLLRPGDPFHMYPSMPFEPALPSEAKFLGSGFGFRPVNHGEGGSGKEFAESLGGNIAREQFTIVLLTYKREAVLMNALQRLKGLPYLNRVLVVWNSPDSPYPELRWPEIGVPVDIVKTQRNSLNNRFLPYEHIETDAILSLDDDAHLRHDEIIFGFRVWRQERDNIVGFPARYHAWDLTHHTWLYNSNYSCELSMVLTGAAFFHKYYAYLYSYVMPQAIRDKVDEYLNCEDIALNFLVAHITRKPPVKVTSRWTFRCPGCEEALSSDDSHFQERHKCINFFVQVYGYMPLLYTQYRVDSVLFKTRISHDKQKCFKFI